MTIEEADFKLIPCSESSSRYDLELLYIVNKGKNNDKSISGCHGSEDAGRHNECRQGT